MLNWKCLGFTSLLSLGLIAACSSDSSTTPKDDAGTISEDLSGNTTNVCVYDGYAAMQGASGETLCLDTEGTLAFWINTDGSYGIRRQTRRRFNGFRICKRNRILHRRKSPLYRKRHFLLQKRRRKPLLL